jgi:hypothetical protein
MDHFPGTLLEDQCHQRAELGAPAGFCCFGGTKTGGKKAHEKMMIWFF